MSVTRLVRAGDGRAGRRLPAWSAALVVIAHPDDESFGLGAVIDQLATAGTAVHILCYTHGEASTLNETCADLHRAREDELRQAAAELGVASVTLLDYPDGGLAGIRGGRARRPLATDAARPRRAAAACSFSTTPGSPATPTIAPPRAPRCWPGGRPGCRCWPGRCPPPSPAGSSAEHRPGLSPGSRRTGSTCAFASAGTGSGGRRCCTPARSRPAPCYGGGCSCRANASTCAGSCRRAHQRIGDPAGFRGCHVCRAGAEFAACRMMAPGRAIPAVPGPQPAGGAQARERKSLSS